MVRILSCIFMSAGLFLSFGAYASGKEENSAIEQHREENTDLEFAREMFYAGGIINTFALGLKFASPKSCEEALSYSIDIIPNSLIIGGTALCGVALVMAIKAYCTGQEDADATQKSSE